MAHAFKASRCAKLFVPPNYMGKAEQGFMRLFYSTTSTGQFFTSTGSCKMIGGVSDGEKKQFIAHNAGHIRNNIVRAEGDYLSAMTFLYGCEPGVIGSVALRLQKNVTKIFGAQLDHYPLKASEALHTIMQSDTEILQLCNLADV